MCNIIRCNKCRKILPYTVQYFRKTYNKNPGLRKVCRKCENEVVNIKNRMTGKVKTIEVGTYKPTPASVIIDFKNKIGTKKCSTCQRVLSLKRFTRNKSSCDGFSYQCHECKQIYRFNRKNKTHSPKQWELRIIEFLSSCAYCGVYLDSPNKEHFFPITPKRGQPKGTNSINNIVPSCVPCNSRKHNSNPVNWIIKTFGPNHSMISFKGDFVL